MKTRMMLAALALTGSFAAGFLLTATGAVAAPQRARYVYLVAEVFLDTAGYNYYLPDCAGCNGYWDLADWCGELFTPLPEVTLILRDAETNEELMRKTARKNYNNGRQWAYFSVPRRDSGFTLEVEAVPEGFQSCPTSPLIRVLGDRELQYSQRLERFYFWWGCPATPPAPPQPPPPPGDGVDHFFGCGVFPIIH